MRAVKLLLFKKERFLQEHVERCGTDQSRCWNKKQQTITTNKNKNKNKQQQQTTQQQQKNNNKQKTQQTNRYNNKQHSQPTLTEQDQKKTESPGARATGRLLSSAEASWGITAEAYWPRDCGEFAEYLKWLFFRGPETAKKRSLVFFFEVLKRRTGGDRTFCFSF